MDIIKKVSAGFFTVVILIFFSACEDEKELVDREEPKITITSPGDQPFLKGTVTIEGTATDDQTVANMQIFIDGVLINEVSANTISVEWDTKSVTEGEHDLKMVATDASGKQTAVTEKVLVKNYFFTVMLKNHVIPEYVDVWFFVSRQDGSLVSLKQHEQGKTTVQLETPDDFAKGQKFTLSTFYHVHKSNASIPSTNLVMEPGLEPGDYTRTVQVYVHHQNFLGHHQVEVTDIESAYYTMVDDDFSNYHEKVIVENKLSLDISLHNEGPTSIKILHDFSAPPRYKTLYDLTDNGFTQVSFEDFSDMTGRYTPSGDDPNSIPVSVTGGFPNSGDYGTLDLHLLYLPLYQGNEKVFPLFIAPHEKYEEYLFSATENKLGGYEVHVRIGTEPPTAFRRCNAILNSFTHTTNVIQVEAAGDFDQWILSGAWGETVDFYTFSRYWAIRLPVGANHTIHLPQLPEQLVNDYDFVSNEELVFTRTEFIDYDGLSAGDVSVFSQSNLLSDIYSVSKETVQKALPIPANSGKHNGSSKHYIDSSSDPFQLKAPIYTPRLSSEFND